MNCLDSKLSRNKSFFTYMTALLAVMLNAPSPQTLRNLSVLYHKTKNLFEAKICMKISK